MPKKHIRPIRVEGQLAYVTLTKGYEAVIDATDVPLVEGFNWKAQIDSHTVYANRTGPRPRRENIIMHRVLMGFPVGLEVDHRDGNGLNNRRANLRDATVSQNRSNRKLGPGNKAKLKGVSWHKLAGKWQAHITANKKHVYLGLFNDADAAHAAYARASAELHGEFGRTG